MRKAHTDKVRATFYIDKRLYQLLKRCSAIENIPMSSIINDDILEQRVGKYAHPTSKDWDDYLFYMAKDIQEEAEQKEYEAYSESPEGRYESAKLLIKKQLEDSQITKTIAEKRLAIAEEEYEARLQKEKIAEKEFEERWIKAVKEIDIE
jgi:uncharacterized protein (DUF1800 family)